MRPSILLLACGALCIGCEAKPQQPANREVWVDPRWPYALVQADLYQIVAFGTADGAVKWRYRREQPPPAPFGQFPVPTVLCRPEWTASHNLVLRYSDGIHVLAAESGELMWTKDLPFQGNCPQSTPDSGIVIIVEHGTRLLKLGLDGETLWQHDFWDTGIAMAQPVVLPGSGDTLLRTERFLINVSPAGKRNWIIEPTAGATTGP